MIKPDNCKFCNSEDLTLVENNEIFNPDTDEYEIMDSFVCNECKAIFVDNKDFSFIQREIDNNKLIQTTDTNITIT